MKFNILPGREGFGTGYTSKRTTVKLYKKQLYTLHQTAFLLCLCSTTVPVLWTAPLVIIIFSSFIVLDQSYFSSRDYSENHKSMIIVLVNPDLHNSMVIRDCFLVEMWCPLVLQSYLWVSIFSEIQWFQAVRHLWTSDYQASGDLWLPDIYGL